MISSHATDDLSPEEPHAQKLRVAWWNTRLSPPVPSPKAVLQGKDRETAYETIKSLVAAFDIVALGEISTEDIAALERIQRSNRLEYVDLTRTVTKHRFNIALVFDRSRCSLTFKELLTDGVGVDTHKIGVQAKFLIDEELILDLFVVHWTSRLSKHEETSDRTHFGSSLRRKINTAKADSLGHAIALGDFNDEPFSISTTRYLGVTRDATHAKNKIDLLYNPFWKSVTCNIGYGRSGQEPEPTGTYYLADDKLHQWRVFDQMMFSSEFLGRSDWHLIEEETGVLRTDDLVQALKDRKCKIDHLPIFCTIAKENPHG